LLLPGTKDLIYLIRSSKFPVLVFRTQPGIFSFLQLRIKDRKCCRPYSAAEQVGCQWGVWQSQGYWVRGDVARSDRFHVRQAIFKRTR